MWWLATFALMLVQVSSDEYSQCYYGTTPRIAQLLVGWTGIALWVRASTNPDRTSRWAVASMMSLGVWLVIVLAWMPEDGHDCQGG